MRIRMLKTVMLPGNVVGVPGQQLDVGGELALHLVAAGKAEIIDPPQVATTIESREPEPEHRDPMPAKPKRKKSRLP